MKKSTSVTISSLYANKSAKYIEYNFGCYDINAALIELPDASTGEKQYEIETGVVLVIAIAGNDIVERSGVGNWDVEEPEGDKPEAVKVERTGYSEGYGAYIQGALQCVCYCPKGREFVAIELAELMADGATRRQATKSVEMYHDTTGVRVMYASRVS